MRIIRATCLALVLVALLLAPSPARADSVAGAWSEVFDWPTDT